MWISNAVFVLLCNLPAILAAKDAAFSSDSANARQPGPLAQPVPENTAAEVMKTAEAGDSSVRFQASTTANHELNSRLDAGIPSTTTETKSIAASAYSEEPGARSTSLSSTQSPPVASPTSNAQRDSTSLVHSIDPSAVSFSRNDGNISAVASRASVSSTGPVSPTLFGTVAVASDESSVGEAEEITSETPASGTSASSSQTQKTASGSSQISAEPPTSTGESSTSKPTSSKTATNPSPKPTDESPVEKESTQKEATASELCASPEFEATPENYVLAETGVFLQNHTLTFASTPSYDKYGLLNTLTSQYMNAQCKPPNCPHSCTEIVDKVLANGYGADDAQRMYFVLLSTKHLKSVFTNIITNLHTAQSNVGLWAPRMATTFFWTEPTHYEKTYDALISFFNSFVQTALASASTIVDFHALAHTSRSAEILLGQRLASAPSSAPAGELVRLRREVERTQKHTRTLEKFAKIHTSKWWEAGVMPFGAGMVPDTIFGQVGRFIAWEGSEGTGNAEMLQVAVQRIAADARKSVRLGVDALWRGSSFDGSGNTAFSTLLAAGAFLPPATTTLTFWSSPETEENLTRALALRTIGIAWSSQPSWISCTHDFQAPDPRRNSYSSPLHPMPSCEMDRSGPQDFKACINGMVCYLNRWNARGGAHTHQLERPFGWEQLAAAPWRTTAEAVIISSVRSYNRKHSADGGQSPVLFTAGMPLHKLGAALWDDKAPGTFQLPVCVSEYNWNGPVEPVFDINCDTNPHCRKKALPCSCGPWGSETRELWEETGLWGLKASKEEYRKHLCPRRIKKRMSSSLERYVALCRLDVRRGWLGWKHTGRDEMCGSVLQALDESGTRGPKELDGMRTAELGCIAGVVTGRKCNMVISMRGREDRQATGEDTRELWRKEGDEAPVGFIPHYDDGLGHWGPAFPIIKADIGEVDRKKAEEEVAAGRKLWRELVPMQTLGPEKPPKPTYPLHVWREAWEAQEGSLAGMTERWRNM